MDHTKQTYKIGDVVQIKSYEEIDKISVQLSHDADAREYKDLDCHSIWFVPSMYRYCNKRVKIIGVSRGEEDNAIHYAINRGKFVWAEWMLKPLIKISLNE